MYEVGTKIDLTYLNKKAVASQPKKSSLQENLETEQADEHYYQAGTRFTFDKETLALRRRIRVSFP